MILEVLLGIFISSSVIIFFKRLNLVKSINKWISVLSKFIYFSGHPLLDEDTIHEEIIVRYRSVFISLGVVILKILLLLLFIFTLIFISSIVKQTILEGSFYSIFQSGISRYLIPEYLLDYPFLVGSLIPIIVVPFIYKKREAINSYTPIHEFLHYTFIGNNNIAMFLFKMELYIHKNKIKKSTSNKNVYISGLARAGTTAILQTLGQIDEFESLSYKHLPFVFLPYSWPKLVRNNNAKESERYHQDGMKHGLESFEALEEPFWRNTLGHQYIKEDRLVHHDIKDKVFDMYTSFRKLVAGDKIYLAKNNNHLLRAESIHRQDKKLGNSTITIVPFRDPYEQSNSLLNQHVILSELQKKNEFTLDYMDFLVHHEFGMNHKPPVLNVYKQKYESSFKEGVLEYWLDIWHDFYKESFAKYSNSSDFYFFCYEDFVLKPEESLEQLLSVLELNPNLVKSIDFKTHKSKYNGLERSKEDKFMELYKKMRLKSLNLL